MKRPSKFDGESAAPASEVLSPSAGPSGPTVIPFPRSSAAALAAEGSEGAGVSSASASSFVLLSVPVRAVVMRLQGQFPRVKVLVPVGEGEDDRDQR